jgi:ATP-dependent DNA helicase RecQ
VTKPVETDDTLPLDDARISDVLTRWWGFDRLRPLQAEAIAAALAGRDSLVVMPTGGGKSLCYQLPPLVGETTDVVISPLVALMKDQVDALEAIGYPAAAIHGGMSQEERSQVRDRLAAGELRLLFTAPERLVNTGLLDLLARVGVKRFAVDEAHCISHWGHDFRPEYRQLALLRDRFPSASIHAFTATATPRVRADIARQLNLRDPVELVGTFDRPNLVYRVVPRTDRIAQTLAILGRHRGEASIVYCISRKETEKLAARLAAEGLLARPYHAGLDAKERNKTQEAFTRETIDIVVATVAFGMGIDRSDVRLVLHTSLPKSLEAYQQETGRAGRDGLAVTFAEFRDRRKILDIEHYTQATLNAEVIPGLEPTQRPSRAPSHEPRRGKPGGKSFAGAKRGNGFKPRGAART